jgi:Transposase DDE domain group 1
VVSCGSTSTPQSASPTELEQNAAATWKKTFGFHPLLAFLDRPEVAGGEALAGLLRAGNAGSNTATDHVTVLTMALAQLPEHARPRPGDPGSPRVLARSDSAGATHLFAAACRKEGWSSPSGSGSMSASRPSWI